MILNGDQEEELSAEPSQTLQAQLPGEGASELVLGWFSLVSLKAPAILTTSSINTILFNAAGSSILGWTLEESLPCSEKHQPGQGSSREPQPALQQNCTRGMLLRVVPFLQRDRNRAKRQSPTHPSQRAGPQGTSLSHPGELQGNKD